MENGLLALHALPARPVVDDWIRIPCCCRTVTGLAIGWPGAWSEAKVLDWTQIAGWRAHFGHRKPPTCRASVPT